MNTKRRFLQSLPRTFDRQYMIKAFSDIGYSVGYADQTLEQWVHGGQLQRIGRGRYRNLEK